MTIVTRVDLDRETRCYVYDGLTIELDYQTIDDSIGEVEIPGEGGCWESLLALHDPEGVVADLREKYRPDQERYDAAEALWVGLQDLARDQGIVWRAERIGP